MVRKLILILLLCVCFQPVVNAQLYDTVSISLPYGHDTTCPGTQLTFTAVHSNPLFTPTYQWYTNNVATGVVIDTFYTTALNDGDSVYCRIFYTNGLGAPDMAQSNTIIIHRADTIAPRVHIALTYGANPDCPGNLLRFTAYPVNGGSAPLYNWRINNALIPGADSLTFSRVFYANDLVSVQMISNSTCSAPFNDTVYSPDIVVLHDSLTAGLSIVGNFNPICQGAEVTFTATTVDAGMGYTIRWYVDSMLIPGAIGNIYVTDSLHNNDLVYAILTAPDSCVINHTTVSNVITMTVIAPLLNTLNVTLTKGANPGCVGDTTRFDAVFTNFGTNPAYRWYVNGFPVDSGKTFLDSVLDNGDIVSFVVRAADSGCYVHDSIRYPNILIIRDSIPGTPWISLIGNMLVASESGTYSWYGPPSGTLIPGAISQTYHPTLLGTYYAIKDTGTCRSDTSNMIYISLLDIEDINNAPLVNLYPNPTTGIIKMDWNSRVSMSVDVYTIQGQGLLHQEIDNTAHHETDLSYLPGGNYFIVLKDHYGGKRTFKVLLVK